MTLNQYTRGILDHLKYGSTWKLVFLSILTLGLYIPFYMRRQTARINVYVDRKDYIPEWYFPVTLGFTALSLFIELLIGLETNFEPKVATQYDTPGGLTDVILAIFLISWAFAARRRMHYLLNPEDKQDLGYMSRLWTFIFSTFYVNYKINRLLQEDDKHSL